MPEKKDKKNQIFLSRKERKRKREGGREKEVEREGEITNNFLSGSVRIMFSTLFQLRLFLKESFKKR